MTFDGFNTIICIKCFPTQPNLVQYIANTLLSYRKHRIEYTSKYYTVVLYVSCGTPSFRRNVAKNCCPYRGTCPYYPWEIRRWEGHSSCCMFWSTFRIVLLYGVYPGIINSRTCWWVPCLLVFFWLFLLIDRCLIFSHE